MWNGFHIDAVGALRRRVFVAGVAALIAGCSGSQPTIGVPPDDDEAGLTAPSASRLLALTMPHYIAQTRHPDHSRTWMAPDAKKIRKLLYISDQTTNDAYVYDYKTKHRVGKLTGLNQPYGQCVDTEGDVWITNWGGNSVVEYAHGGAKPLQTLTTDPEPIGCAIDPTTGNLAVSSWPGTLDIFAGASGQKHQYDGICYPIWPPGYDKAGNLYLEGIFGGTQGVFGGARTEGTNDPLVCEMPHGSYSIKPVELSGARIYFTGSVTWDGKHLVLFDQEYMGVYQTGGYQVTEDSSGNLTAIGETGLSDDCDGDYVDVVQPFIVGTKNTPVNRKQGAVIVGGNTYCDSEGYGQVDFWSYPTGGNPISRMANPPAQPYGQSVSILP